MTQPLLLLRERRGSLMHTVVLDLAGTTIDCGCMAPVTVLIEVFRRRGVQVSERMARAAMGPHRQDLIRQMCDEPRVRAAWIAAQGREPTHADADAMCAETDPLLIARLPLHCHPIPGFVEVAATLRKQGLRLGATTGHTGPMVDVIRPLIAAEGWDPEVLLCASDVPAGRPAPYMNQLVAMRLGAPDVRRCVVVGDTGADMEAARNAGMWAVGVALTGNQVGLPWEAVLRLHRVERELLRDRAAAHLTAAGAHMVIDSVLDLPAALEFLTRPSAAAFKRWQRR